MIRDILALRCKDSAATAQLFRKQEEPTLKVAINELKVSESTKKQMQELNSNDQQLHHMMKKCSHKKESKQYGKPDQNNEHNDTCIYCEKAHRPGRASCPAYGKICKKGGKPDHFRSVCYTNQSAVNMVNSSSDRETDSDNSADSNTEYRGQLMPGVTRRGTFKYTVLKFVIFSNRTQTQEFELYTSVYYRLFSRVGKKYVVFLVGQLTITNMFVPRGLSTTCEPT